MKRPLILLLILIAAFLPSCASDIEISVVDTEGQVRVVRVIDGDTIEVEGGARVRYIGIDAPEVYPQTEYYGPEAWARNSELVEGKTVTLEKDVSETDVYGRLLRYVWVDGVFVNGELVRLGYARAISYPPDTKYQERLAQLEEEAREARRGLWR
jgi:micrococcal nuclease